jgi:hypothetical protein
MKIFLLQPASKALWDRIQKNKLNIELTWFYKIVNGITASNQGFYNNFQYKMRLEVTPLKESNLIKRQNDSVPGLVILIALTMNDSFTPLPSLITLTLGILPRSVSYYDNLKISVGEFGAMANRILLIEGNETVQSHYG